ncbi:alpha/beta hydrolase [Curtobacterium sp. MCBA15_001]|uniref:alpha/beta hydrolase n=1 Tax=Curtobacterium sp. MCBA15_001 TaxID=1898731 RepID=UPI000A894361|nr:alpha/beta hydrolase [Curtobacterium sp. MCBA15_001]
MSRRTHRRATAGIALVAAGVTAVTAVVAGVARRAAALYASPELEPRPGLQPVSVRGADGQALPGWVTPTVGDGTRWAVALPGLGSHPLRHQEIAPALAAHGYTALFAAHSARWPARRHGFGVRETDEALAWLRVAADHGAREVTLLGWSFGGALWLHALDAMRREPLRRTLADPPLVVRAVVLTGPLVDWVPTIAHGIGGGRLGRALGRAVVGSLAVPGLARLAGQAGRLRIRPPALTGHPMPLLVVHSDADTTVPLATSRALVAAWSGPSRLLVVHGARHGAERDGDPNGWLDAVSTTV